MIIRAERSGGFAGLRKSVTLDTRELSLQDRQELASLIDAANFFNLPGQIHSPQPGADRFQYKVSVERQGQKHQVTFDDNAGPNGLSALAKWVDKRM